MANRRFGGNVGSQRGGLNRNYPHPPSSNISPWQGGSAPSNPQGNNIQNQLALALTNLIQQSTQPSAPQGGPPSLLNMNTNNPGGYFNQPDQFNNQNRFGNRGRQDFRRSEPYNKNRGGAWRSDNRSNNNRGSGNFSSNKKLGNRNQRTPAKDKKKDKTPAKQEKEEDRKDDIKEEAKTDDEATTTSTSSKKAPKRTRYDGLPNGLLHCFVCNKSMWDGESFQNHLGGKAHKQMINSLEGSFQITVNILRENMRLCEERKMIEFERMQRSRRYNHKNPQEPEGHCNMCDLKFLGKIVVHRQTEGHQRLKRFLHPKCKRCNMEFPSRMEWVDHQFIPEHLVNLKEYLESKKLEIGEYKLKLDTGVDNDQILEEGVQHEDESPVLEMSEDLTNLFNRIPVYKSSRAIAKESLSASNGFKCELCSLFLPTEEDSQNHLKSYKHYQAFVEAVKLKYQKDANEKKRKAEEEAALQENELEGSKEEIKDEDDFVERIDGMYDPFTVADCEDGEAANGEEEPVEEGEAEGKEEEEIKEEVMQEEEKEEVTIVEEKIEVPATTTTVTPTPAQKKGAPAAQSMNSPGRPKRAGNTVKNGAGPKSKKMRN